MAEEAQDGLGLLTVRNAAKAIGVLFTFLQREVKEGHVPSLRMGNSTRVDMKVVRAALQRRSAGMYADSLFGQLTAPVVPAHAEIVVQTPPSESARELARPGNTC